MPHLVLEYSANLEADVDMQTLCKQVLKVAVDTGFFPLGGVRVRAIKCEHFAIADQHEKNGFIDVSIRIGQGRDLDTKKNAGEMIFTAMSQFLAEKLEQPHFALSLEIREIDKQLSWKANSMHSRLA